MYLKYNTLSSRGLRFRNKNLSADTVLATCLELKKLLAILRKITLYQKKTPVKLRRLQSTRFCYAGPLPSCEFGAFFFLTVYHILFLP